MPVRQLGLLDVKTLDDARAFLGRYYSKSAVENRIADMRARGSVDLGSSPDMYLEISNPGTASAPRPAAGPAAPAPALDSLVTVTDLASLGVGGETVQAWPNRGWAYVNKPVRLASSAREMTLDVELAGLPVRIVATPVRYTWRTGDGTSFTTTSPGDAAGSVTHTYTRPAGGMTLSVETEWTASYTVSGQTFPVDGTLTTTATSAPFDVIEAEAVLVQ